MCLVHLRARWYQPSSGTFLSHDPFAGFPQQPASLQPYQYAFNDPVHHTDPGGKNPLLCAVPAVVDLALPLGDMAAIACFSAYGASAAAGVAAGQSAPPLRS